MLTFKGTITVQQLLIQMKFLSLLLGPGILLLEQIALD